MKNKILYVSRREQEGSTNHDLKQAIYQNKKYFFQVLCHILSGSCFLCSRTPFPFVLCLLHTTWPVAFKSVLKGYPAILEHVKESLYQQLKSLVPFLKWDAIKTNSYTINEVNILSISDKETLPSTLKIQQIKVPEL